MKLLVSSLTQIFDYHCVGLSEILRTVLLNRKKLINEVHQQLRYSLITEFVVNLYKYKIIITILNPFKRISLAPKHSFIIMPKITVNENNRFKPNIVLKFNSKYNSLRDTKQSLPTLISRCTFLFKNIYFLREDKDR